MKTIDLYWIRCSHKVGKEDSQKMKAFILRNRYGECVPPVITEPGGKPRFLAGGEGFSVSHSENYFAMAFCDGQIGIDLEITVKERVRTEAIARRFFTEEEQERIRSADHPRRAFTRLWTQKEALVKMTGEGLSALRRAKEKEFRVLDISEKLQSCTGDPELFGCIVCDRNYITRMVRMDDYETIYQK